MKADAIDSMAEAMIIGSDKTWMSVSRQRWFGLLMNRLAQTPVAPLVPPVSEISDGRVEVRGGARLLPRHLTEESLMVLLRTTHAPPAAPQRHARALWDR